MDWETPNFEVVETSAEMTAYAGHWADQEGEEVGEEREVGEEEDGA